MKQFFSNSKGTSTNKGISNNNEISTNKGIRGGKNAFALVLASFIWGTAFVAQATGGEIVGPYGFNCIRNLIAPLVMIPVIKLLDYLKLSGKKPASEKERKLLWKAGILCGIALCVASNLQQVAINMGAGTGKAGFLTALYILMVPIISIALGKKSNINIWIGVVLAIVGVYLLANLRTLDFTLPDALLIACAICFSVQILLIDHYAPLVDNVRLACVQFLVCGVLTIPLLAAFEWHFSAEGFQNWVPALENPSVWGSILYAAVFSSGVAYTLQIVGQNNFNPTIASMLMSLESVFAALSGWVLLHQSLSGREIAGCAFIFVAIIIAQLPTIKFRQASNHYI